MSQRLPTRQEHLESIDKEHRLTRQLPSSETLVLLRVEALLIEQNELLRVLVDSKPSKKPKPPAQG